MPAQVKGYRMKYIVEEVQEKKGELGVKELEKEYGSLDFNSSQIYSEEENINLLVAATKVIFGNTDNKNLFEMGRILAQKLLSSTMTQIGFKMVSAMNIFKGAFFNPTILRRIEKTIPHFAPSLKVQLENPDKNTLIIRFLDSKMPRKLYEGEWFELFSALSKAKLNSSSKQLTDTSYEIIIKSEEFHKIKQYFKKKE